MPYDLAFDPITQDEITEVNGSPKLTRNADTAVQLAMLVHYQESWHDPEMGSRFHNLSLFQADPVPLAEQEALRVLERLEDQGRIADVEVAAEEGSGGRLKVATRFRDTNTGQLVNTFIRSGG
jgi:phage gp46-like protein